MSSHRPNMGDGSFIAFRPEVALRRAKDHENIGQMHEACAHLHDVLVSKRMGRLWNINHEKMMIEFINLCTDLRETRRTKDGLYHYRQLTQMQNPQSLEKVVHHMIDSAQVRAAEAKARFLKESGAPAGVSNVEDLEEEEQSPESLLMGAVTSEGTKERLEREILVPWLRHVWDTFRNVLENIRYVPRLENLYHSTVIKAMQFCKNYSRTAEFKKLCNMLRNHLLAQRRSQDNNGVVMTQEQIERHLNTRFVQLEHCAELNLWTEGFRTVEDIFGIMALSDAAPRAQLMATYYEKLARIFWVSENYLFHAYAWYKFFSLSFTQNKSLNDEDKRNMASAVLLAALAIPVYAAGPGTSAAYNTETAGTPLEIDRERDKKFRLASLLKHEAATSREALITEIVSKGVLRHARPEVASLFHLLEEEFAPLALISRAEPCLAQLRQEVGPTLSSAGTLGGSASALAHSLAQYVPNLEKLLVFRTLQQLGKVYSLFKLQTFRTLISQLEIGFHDTEKMITRAVKNRLLAVRLNHRQGCIRFGDDSAENVASRRHLTLLAARLQSIVQAFNAGAACNPLAERIPQMFNLARESLSISQHVVLERKLQIDAIKEQKQKELQEKARWDARERQMAAAKRDELEAQLKRDAEEYRRQQELNQIVMQQAYEANKRLAAIIGLDVDHMGPDELAKMDRAALEQQAREIALKARDDELKRRTEQAKRVDYLVRALRETERPKAEAASRQLYEQITSVVTVYNENTLAEALEKRATAAALKSSLSKMVPHVTAWEDRVLEARRAVYDAEKSTMRTVAYGEFLQRKVQHARERRERAMEHARIERERAEEERRREDEAAAQKARELRDAALRAEEPAPRFAAMPTQSAAQLPAAYVPPQLRNSGLRAAPAVERPGGAARAGADAPVDGRRTMGGAPVREVPAPLAPSSGPALGRFQSRPEPAAPAPAESTGGNEWLARRRAAAAAAGNAAPARVRS